MSRCRRGLRWAWTLCNSGVAVGYLPAQAPGSTQMSIAQPQWSPEVSERGGPTVLRILLGAQLRRLREGLGLTREDASAAIRGSESKISRLELGRVGFKVRDVADLLDLYGITDGPRREA